MAFDVHKNLKKALNTMYGSKDDLTTQFARKIAQDRQISTSDAVIYAGKDIVAPTRKYVNDLTTV